MRVTKDLITDTTYKIRDVDEGEEYEFRVSAENEAGVGKPSEPCGVVIKDPFGEWLFGYLSNVLIRDHISNLNHSGLLFLWEATV